MKATVEKVCSTTVSNVFKNQLLLLEVLVIDVQNNQLSSVSMEYHYAALVPCSYGMKTSVTSDLGSFWVG